MTYEAAQLSPDPFSFWWGLGMISNVSLPAQSKHTQWGKPENRGYNKKLLSGYRMTLCYKMKPYNFCYVQNKFAPSPTVPIWAWFS